MDKTRDDAKKQMSLLLTEIASSKIEVGNLRSETEILKKATHEAELIMEDYKRLINEARLSDEIFKKKYKSAVDFLQSKTLRNIHDSLNQQEIIDSKE